MMDTLHDSNSRFLTIRLNYICYVLLNVINTMCVIRITENVKWAHSTYS